MDLSISVILEPVSSMALRGRLARDKQVLGLICCGVIDAGFDSEIPRARLSTLITAWSISQQVRKGMPLLMHSNRNAGSLLI